MGLPKTKLMTEAEYLAFERPSEVRHLYVDGEIFAMAGESPEHADVNTNLVAAIAAQLKGTSCRARFNNTRVRSGPITSARRNFQGMYSYPDAVVICDEPEYLDDQRDTVLNPKAIFEVLSPSTESFDRGGKFERYRDYNPTLTDYVLVAQDKPYVEHYQRQANGDWLCSYYSSLKAKAVIASIDVTLRLRDVYDRVTFDAK